jgi:hypothetical protein
MLTIKSAKHITWKRADGNIINPKCNHPLIPGLDADFCEVCRIYWIDAQETEIFFARKRNRT